MITQERLKEVLNYDPETGVFTSKVRLGYRGKNVGDIVGVEVTRSHTKYLTVQIDKYKTYLHRLAYLYMTGEIPLVIDHEDGNGLNNKWSNLINGTQQHNNQNVTRVQFNKLEQLPLGVFRKGNRFLAAIKVNYRKVHLGSFVDVIDASNAYQEAKKIYHVR